MAKKKKAKKDKPKGRKLGTFLLLLVSGVLVVLIKTTFMFLLLALLPALVAFYSDNSDNKNNYRVVFLCNLSGAMPFIAEMIAKGNQMSHFQSIISNPNIWFIVYSSAAFGWLLVWGCPHLIEIIYEIKYQSKVKKLETNQTKLIEEWGPEIQRLD